MNRRSVFLGQLSDMWGWFIFFVGMIMWFIIFTVASENLEYNLGDQQAYLEDKTELINMLQTPSSDDLNLADEIVFAVANSQQLDLQAKQTLDEILNSIYGRQDNVCWTLWYTSSLTEEPGNILANIDCPSDKNILFDQSVILPSQSYRPIKIRLAVLGYKE